MIRYLPSNKEFSKTSRYQVLRVIEDKDTYLETYNQVEVPLSDGDSYHVVKHSEVNRLDIIANTFYGRSDYWWAIALANNFIDPFVVQEGVMIRIPSVITLNNRSYKILIR